MSAQMTLVLINGVVMPTAGIGTVLLSPDEAEASCVNALTSGCRLIGIANAYVNERAVDLLMAAALLLLMSYSLIGEAAHGFIPCRYSLSALMTKTETP